MTPSPYLFHWLAATLVAVFSGCGNGVWTTVDSGYYELPAGTMNFPKDK